MRKIFTLWLMIVSGVALNHLNAQSFTILPTDSVYLAGSVTSDFDDIESYIYFKNTDVTAKSITWHLFSDTIVPGWELKLCDNNNCYDLLANNNPYTTSPVNPGDTLIMKSQFSPHCMSGSGMMHVTTRVSGSAAPAVTITFKVDATAACLSAIADASNQLSALSLFPNPVNNQVSIGGLEPGHTYQIQITDIEGRLLSDYKNTSNGTVSYNVNTLPAGFYFVKIVDGERKLSAVRKFSKQ